MVWEAQLSSEAVLLLMLRRSLKWNGSSRWTSDSGIFCRTSIWTRWASSSNWTSVRITILIDCYVAIGRGVCLYMGLYQPPSARELIELFLDCLFILMNLIWYMWIRWQDKLKETDGGRQRFLLELEFVQLLANPTYIHRMCWPAFHRFNNVIWTCSWSHASVLHLIASSDRTDRKSRLLRFNFSF